jgi:hypothetical protein
MSSVIENSRLLWFLVFRRNRPAQNALQSVSFHLGDCGVGKRQAPVSAECPPGSVKPLQLPSGPAKTLRISPGARLCLQQVHGGLYELKGFGVSDPNDLEARLLALMFNPNKVTRPHMFTDAGQQSATSA